MVGATTADIAVWVAIGSAAVSLTTLLWQLTLYRLSGPRPVVRLIPAVLTETGHLVKGPDRGWRRSMPPSINVVHDRPWVDAALIEIVNVGRTPISLSSITLDIGASVRWKPWQRHTVGMPPIAVHGGLDDIDRVRLDAGHAVDVFVDPWPALMAARKGGHRVYVRASVLPAGRRPVRSAWHRRWSVDSNRQHLWPFGPDGDEVELFQAVWQEIAPVAPKKIYEVWLDVLGLLVDEDVDPKNVTVLQVNDALKSVFELRQQGMWPSVRILRAVHEYGQAGGWLPTPLE
jgi:hypothetical protein